MHKIKWDDLQFVLAVAEGGSLAAAARALGVNHTTVLRRLIAFEERLGVRLFERHASGYRLSAESKHVLSTIRGIDKSVQGLERAIAGQGADFEGSLRLTSTDSLFKSVLIRHVQSFRARHTAVILDLNVTNTRLNFAKLDADITVRPAKVLPPDLAGEKVSDLTFMIYGAPSYLAGNPSADLADHTWLGLTEPLMHSPPGQWQENAVPEASVVVRSDSFVTLADMAAAGMGLAMMPCCLGDTTPGLVRAKLFPAAPQTSLWIAAHPDLLRSPHVQTFTRFFFEALSEDRALLSGQTAFAATG